MDRAALPGRLSWHRAEVVAARPETARARSITVDIASWPGHRAGQRVDLRLTADDGYRVERSYSIASPPEDGGRLTLTVDRIIDGEVSPYLVDELRVGDHLELRGPIGEHFVWEVAHGGPLQLVAGGSGVAPLMAMRRHRAAAGSDVPARLLYSARSLDDVIYRDELTHIAGGDRAVEVTLTLTRSQPPGWTELRRRVDAAMMGERAWPTARRPLVFVCGPTEFVEAAASALVALGHPPDRVRTERFGASGPGAG